jgi:hypothetical protein
VKVLDVFLKNPRIFLKNIFALARKWPWLHANEVWDPVRQKSGPTAAEVTLMKLPNLRE